MGNVVMSAAPHQALLGAQHFNLVGHHLLAYRMRVISAAGDDHCVGTTKRRERVNAVPNLRLHAKIFLVGIY